MLARMKMTMTRSPQMLLNDMDVFTHWVEGTLQPCAVCHVQSCAELNSQIQKTIGIFGFLLSCCSFPSALEKQRFVLSQTTSSPPVFGFVTRSL